MQTTKALLAAIVLAGLVSEGQLRADVEIPDPGCQELERFGIRDQRELGVEGSSFYQFQRWLCAQPVASLQAAKDRAAILQLTPEIFARSTRDAKPTDWPGWRGAICGAEKEADAFEPAGVAKTISRDLNRRWERCLSRDGVHAWFEIGADSRQYAIAARASDGLKIGLRAETAGKPACGGQVPATAIAVAAAGWRQECNRDPTEAITLTVEWGKEKRQIVLPAMSVAQPPFRCFGPMDPPEDIAKKMRADRRYFACVKPAEDMIAPGCRDGTAPASCARALALRNLGMAAPQLLEAETRCRAKQLDESSCEDWSIAKSQFNEALERLKPRPVGGAF